MSKQELTPLQIVAHGLKDFFKDEPEKITYWLFTANLNFGGFSPAQLLAGDKERQEKVSNFILAAQEMGGWKEGV